MFFFDIDGHADEPHVAKALAALKKRASLFRVLGFIPARRVVTAPGELALDWVRTLAPYVPGKPIEELSASSASPTSSSWRRTRTRSGPARWRSRPCNARSTDTWLYPDGSGHQLKHKLAKKLGVDVNQITLGNGSNDVLVLLAEAFLAPGLEAVYSQYGFAVYPIAIQATGAKGVCVPALPEDSAMPLGHDLGAMARAITPRTRVVFVANPNNPTGTWVPTHASWKLSSPRCRAHVVLALDEAYFEYSGGLPLQNGIEWLSRYPNLVVFRTFSKAYGLAGVRVGYSISHPSVADMLNRVRQPFNVSAVGLAGAAAALDDPTHVAAAVDVAIAERARVSARLAQAGTRVVPSAGNFLLLHAGPEARARFESLLRKGIIVRPVGNYGLAEHLRVTLGTRAQNDRFLSAWEASRDGLGTHRHHRRTFELGQGHHQPYRRRARRLEPARQRRPVSAGGARRHSTESRPRRRGGARGRGALDARGIRLGGSG